MKTFQQLLSQDIKISMVYINVKEELRAKGAIIQLLRKVSNNTSIKSRKGKKNSAHWTISASSSHPQGEGCRWVW